MNIGKKSNHAEKELPDQVRELLLTSDQRNYATQIPSRS